MLLQGTTDAQHVRDETVPGTLCRMFAARTGSATLAGGPAIEVWHSWRRWTTLVLKELIFVLQSARAWARGGSLAALLLARLGAGDTVRPVRDARYGRLRREITERWEIASWLAVS